MYAHAFLRHGSYATECLYILQHSIFNKAFKFIPLLQCPCCSRKSFPYYITSMSCPLPLKVVEGEVHKHDGEETLYGGEDGGVVSEASAKDEMPKETKGHVDNREKREEVHQRPHRHLKSERTP